MTQTRLQLFQGGAGRVPRSAGMAEIVEVHILKAGDACPGFAPGAV
jgi:hypothetical protein